MHDARSLLLALVLTVGWAGHLDAAGATTPAVGDFPIWIELERPQLVTVVIEDAQGVTVRNLMAETRLPPGRNRLSWDGYDNGRSDANGDLVRRRVAPGTYRARGLTHDGLTLVYEFTVYSGGNPPWPNAAKTGGWLADHSCPLGALFLPAKSGSPYGAGAPQVLLTALVAEAGAPFVWVGLDGQTLQRRQVWGWDGAIAAARDAGAGADPGVYAYLVMAGDKWISIRGLKTDGEGTEICRFDQAKAGPGEPRHDGYSLAVHDRLVVFNAIKDELLVFADVAERKVIGTVSMPGVRALQFDPQGRLLIARERTVTSHAVARPKPGADGAPKLGDAKVLIDRGLDDPRTLAFDPAAKELYVADWGRSHQVKVFTPAGKFLRAIGKASDGAQVGLYDEHKMQRPLGLAIDDRGQLWIAEADHLPKRISRWNATSGALIGAHYGPPRYGGGGTIDPADRTRMFYQDYYGLIEFALDWEKGTAKPKAIPVRGADVVQQFGPEYGHHPEGGPSRWGFVNERPVHVGGRTYLTGSWQGGLRGNDTSVTWLLGDDHIARPVARIGGDGFSWPPQLNQAFLSVRPKTHGWRQLVAWSDRNGNGRVDAEEFTVRSFDKSYTDEAGQTHPVEGFVTECVFPDLSMTANWALHVPAPTFDAKGVPLYDVEAATFLLPHDPLFRFDEQHHWGQSCLPMSGGWVVTGLTGWKDRRRMWSYPTIGHAVPRLGGEVNQPTRLLGPPMKGAGGEAGDWFATNGERGNIFLMTADGLYLQTLGGDMRAAPLLRIDNPRRGMVVDEPDRHISFEDEHFHPTMTQTTDGTVYLVAGKEHSSVFRVTGLDSVRRRQFQQLALDAKALAALPEQLTVRTRKPTATQLLVTVGGADPVVDGRLDEYADWAAIGESGERAGAVHAGADRLYAGWRTGDPACLANGGGEATFLFKRGGCVDLMIRTDPEADGKREPVAGDLRLLVTTVAGKPRAVLYRAVVPGVAAKDRTRFESPVGAVSFDAVADVSNQLTLVQAGGDVEISIPLATLGLKAAVGREIRGDLGILRGDGAQTIQRLYWSNTDTLIVSDIPSEARLQPGNWGTWRLVPAIPAQPRAAAAPGAVQPGLRYAYLQGNRDRLPDFAAQTAAATGLAPAPRLDAITQRKGAYAVEFTGFVRVPTAGVWAFTTGSDDGSRLWIGDTLVVDNDGQHGPQDRSGSIRLAACLHPLRIGYFQDGGGETLEVRWKGPGVAEQPLPAGVLVHTP